MEAELPPWVLALEVQLPQPHPVAPPQRERPLPLQARLQVPPRELQRQHEPPQEQEFHLARELELQDRLVGDLPEPLLPVPVLEHVPLQLERQPEPLKHVEWPEPPLQEPQLEGLERPCGADLLEKEPHPLSLSMK